MVSGEWELVRFGYLLELIQPKGRTLSKSIPMVRNQPSIITNSSNLKGNEISTGGSIIMPMLIRTEEMTISMTRKGR